MSERSNVVACSVPTDVTQGPASEDEGRSLSRKAANGQLIERVVREPHAGMALLFDRFSVTVNRLVRRFMGPHPDHDDVVQTAFCAMMDSIHQVREPEKLEAWVRSVTVNAILQELRRQRFRRALVYRATPGESRRDFVHDIETRDLLKHARALLDAMPAAERVVFMLHYAESLTMNEVAESCGYSLATAKRKLARARQRFQRLAVKDADLKRLVGARGDHDAD